MAFFEDSHRRFNPLTEEWVLCSPNRAERPWQGQIEKSAATSVPSYDPNCYLCPGNERAGHIRNPDYKATFAFDNDFAALKPNGPHWQVYEEDLLIAHAESGTCRVLCFSPSHDLALAQMQTGEIRLVVDAWAEEALYLGARDDINYVQIFENKGQAMGCSNPHPHCQIWATKHVPQIPAAKSRSQQAYFRSHDKDMLGDYLKLELAKQDRLIGRNEHWVALVPFWAAWPFEAMLIPVRLVPDLSSLKPEEREALADIIKRLTVRYDNLFRTSFPYSMGWHSCPTDEQAHPYWRLHAVFYPPLLRSATIRKFLVGYEMTAEPQRDITPEQAAARLREVPEVHYLIRDAKFEIRE